MSSIEASTSRFPKRIVRRLTTLGLCLLWSLIVLYPNPTLLPRAVANAYDPKIDPEAVRAWADELPDDPAYIERQVERHYVSYAVPWETYGVPWYYPTTREVVEKGAGDCQGQMLVLASILEAKGIPYQLRASFDHIWVEYPGKQETRGENAAIALMDNGRLQVPEQWDWRATYRIEKEYFWDTAPLLRKLLLFAGLAVIILRRPIQRSTSGQWSRLGQARAKVADHLLDSVRAWESNGRISAKEAEYLRNQLLSPDVTDVAPHLGAHMAIGMLLPFPFASLGRATWTLWMLLSTLARRIIGRTDHAAWQRAWRIHHPLVAALSAVPVVGSFAYLLATPARGNHLLVRIAIDAGLARTPLRLYERSGTQRLLTYGRPARNGRS